MNIALLLEMAASADPDRTAVVSGDILISLAGVDLIRLDLRLLLVAVGSVEKEPR